MRPCLIPLVLYVAVNAQPLYWWRLNNTDAPHMDIKQLPCGKNCTLQELQSACSAEQECVAVNTAGWLKNSLSGMVSGAKCDLFIKKTTPQPSPAPPSAAPFWPVPVNVSYGALSVNVSSRLTVAVFPPAANGSVQAYANRLWPFIFVHTPDPTPPGELALVNVHIANASVLLQLGVDESYTLSIPADGTPATLVAATVYGAYMGLQTLSQAIRFDFNARVYTVSSAPIVIHDEPRFAWRGLLIDTDRHWLSLRHIRRIIDAMGYVKLNVLHWHIVDWQAWPLESPSYPDLWTAAWSPRERYTLADVAAIIAYANAQGVRVVPEFDTPGHASSMCHAYPNLCSSLPNCGWTTNAPLTPVPDSEGRNVSLDAIAAVLGEISAVSPDQFLHLGGDEVAQGCWATDPAVLAWMATQGMGNNTDLVYEYFVDQVDNIAIKGGKIPMRWEEVWVHFGTRLDRRTIIHAWLNASNVVDATSHGYRTVWSIDTGYYLPHLNVTWETFYNQDPLGGIANASAAALVLGGETCMWGETADGADALQTIFPRAAAAAERQWSYDVVTGAADPGTAARFQALRCLLLERGIAAAPATNPTARTAPSGPGSCLDQ